MTPSRYNEVEHRKWVRRLGMLHADLGPSGKHQLENCRVHVWWPVGCYVGVNLEQRVNYVGKVCRTDDGFDSRFASHHQDIDAWAYVWLLPLRLDVPAQVVKGIEALLIWVLRPSDNLVRPRVRMVHVQHWMRYGSA
jgi:hypothetical protein